MSFRSAGVGRASPAPGTRSAGLSMVVPVPKPIAVAMIVTMPMIVMSVILLGASA